MAFAELTLGLFPIDEDLFAFGYALLPFTQDIGVPSRRLERVRVAGEIRPKRLHGAQFLCRGHAVEREGDIHDAEARRTRVSGKA